MSRWSSNIKPFFRADMSAVFSRNRKLPLLCMEKKNTPWEWDVFRKVAIAYYARFADFFFAVFLVDFFAAFFEVFFAAFFFAAIKIFLFANQRVFVKLFL
jgi:hypothetical protein